MARHGRAFPLPIKFSKYLALSHGICGHSGIVSSSGSSASMTISLSQGVHTVICWVQTAGDISTPTLSDGLGNTWGSLIATNVSYRAEIFHSTVATGGTTSVTATIGGSATSWLWQAFSICPLYQYWSVRKSLITGTNEDAATTSHFCAAPSGFNTQAQSTIIACASGGAGSGGFTPTTTQVEYRDYAKNTGALMMTAYSANALTNERAPFSTVNSVNCKGCVVSFYNTLNDELQWSGASCSPLETGLDVRRTRVIGF